MITAYTCEKSALSLLSMVCCGDVADSPMLSGSQKTCIVSSCSSYSFNFLQFTKLEQFLNTNFKEKTLPDQDLNSGLQLYTLMLSHPDGLLGQARIFPLISLPLYLQTGNYEFNCTPLLFPRAKIMLLGKIIILLSFINCFNLQVMNYQTRLFTLNDSVIQDENELLAYLLLYPQGIFCCV